MTKPLEIATHCCLREAIGFLPKPKPTTQSSTISPSETSQPMLGSQNT